MRLATQSTFVGITQIAFSFSVALFDVLHLVYSCLSFIFSINSDASFEANFCYLISPQLDQLTFFFLFLAECYKKSFLSSKRYIKNI